MVSENGTGKLEIHFMISWRHLGYVRAAGLILTARSTKLSLSHKAKSPMLELREGGRSSQTSSSALWGPEQDYKIMNNMVTLTP